MPPVALSHAQHASLTYKVMDDYAFATAMTTMPLLLFEVPKAARCFPILFPEARSATPHALLGLGGVNVFVDERGRWKADYVPLAAANHPFSLVAGPEKTDLALAIEEDAPQFRQPDGDPLFGPDGEPTEPVRRVLTALGRQYRHYQDSRQPLAELNLTGALCERVVSVRGRDGERKVGGLRVADRDKIMALPAATLGTWARNGLLEMLFAHWQSLRHLQTLLDHPSCPGLDGAAGEDHPVQ